MYPILRLCNSCKFYDEELANCIAFPKGIPLKSSEHHVEVKAGQVGETIYDMDPEKYDLFEAWRRIHPDKRFPVIIYQDVPEGGDDLVQEDVEVEE